MANSQLKGNNKQIDQSLIPPAVRRAAEEAERLQQAHIAGEELPQPELSPEPVQQPQERPQPTHQDTRRETPPEPPQPTHPEPPREHKPDDGDPNAETWRARFESEQGRTRKLREDVNSLSSRISEMTQLLSTMQTAQPAPVQAELKFERQVTPEMESEWGADFFKAVEARAREIVEPIKVDLENKIASLGGNVENVSKTLTLDARGRMLKALDGNETIKDWRIINDDQEFVAWLKQVDRLSGRLRHDMLLEAWNANDASRVAASFESFLRERTATAPQAAAQPGTAPAGKPTLDQFVAPGRARSAPAPTGQSDDEIITTADIARFYADRAANRFNTPDLKAKADAYEQQIFKAQREGRIKP